MSELPVLTCLQQDLEYSIERLDHLEFIRITGSYHFDHSEDTVLRWIEEEKLISANLRRQVIAYMASKEESTETKENLKKLLTVHHKERLNVNRYHYLLKLKQVVKKSLDYKAPNQLRLIESDLNSLQDEINENRRDISQLLRSFNCRTLDDICFMNFDRKPKKDYFL